VNRNDEVNIIASFGNVKITAKGIARESGAVGEIIQVEYPGTRKLILGKIIAPNAVSMER
jgi:flagella basal body P-ring formation protein FlgA